MARNYKNEIEYIPVGNTVRKVSSYEAYPDRRKSRPREVHPVEQARPKRRRRSAGRVSYLLFTLLAFIGVAFVLIWYVSLQSEITATQKNIASLESRLNTLTQENDEALRRAESSIDLEEVRRIATEELGMKYATEGQTITYTTPDNNDYVTQYSDIPMSGANP